MITGISHVTLSVKQLARSYRFYVDVLRCKPVATAPDSYVPARRLASIRRACRIGSV